MPGFCIALPLITTAFREVRQAFTSCSLQSAVEAWKNWKDSERQHASQLEASHWDEGFDDVSCASMQQCRQPCKVKTWRQFVKQWQQERRLQNRCHIGDGWQLRTT